MEPNATTSHVRHVASDESFSYEDILSDSNSSLFEFDSEGNPVPERHVIPNSTETDVDECFTPITTPVIPAASAAAAAAVTRPPQRRRIRYSNGGAVHRKSQADRATSHPEEIPPADVLVSANRRTFETGLPVRNVCETVGEKEVLPTPTSSRIKQIDSETAIKILGGLDSDDEPSKSTMNVFYKWIGTPSVPRMQSGFGKPPNAGKTSAGDDFESTAKTDDVGLNIFPSWYRDLWGQTFHADNATPHILHKCSYLFHSLWNDEENSAEEMDVFHKWLAVPSARDKADVKGLNLFVNWYRDLASPEHAEHYNRPSVLQRCSLPFQHRLYAEKQRKKKKKIMIKNSKLEFMKMSQSDSSVDGVRVATK